MFTLINDVFHPGFQEKSQLESTVFSPAGERQVSHHLAPLHGYSWNSLL